LLLLLLLLLLLFFFFFFRSLADQKLTRRASIYTKLWRVFFVPTAMRCDSRRDETKTRREEATTSPALLQRSATASDDARACDGKTSSPPAAKGNNTVWERQCNNGDPQARGYPTLLPASSARSQDLQLRPNFLTHCPRFRPSCLL
jgi:hypothetical protein